MFSSSIERIFHLAVIVYDNDYGSGNLVVKPLFLPVKSRPYKAEIEGEGGDEIADPSQKGGAAGYVLTRGSDYLQMKQ